MLRLRVIIIHSRGSTAKHYCTEIFIAIYSLSWNSPSDWLCKRDGGKLRWISCCNSQRKSFASLFSIPWSFTYANRNLYFSDSLTARLYRNELGPGVVADLNEWITFNREHVSFIEPFIKWIYGKYLQGNQQPQGMQSYDEVTAFIISYYKKFGKI